MENDIQTHKNCRNFIFMISKNGSLQESSSKILSNALFLLNRGKKISFKDHKNRKTYLFSSWL